jgi:hypothetical protein
LDNKLKGNVEYIKLKTKGLNNIKLVNQKYDKINNIKINIIIKDVD